ncbi:MAG: ADOP family duplicated permease [Acidobacteriota bacterium]
MLRLAIARIRALFRRNATADEIREELQFHVAMRTDDYARQGLDVDAARRAALRRFGNPAVIQDRGYDVRGGGVLETIIQDVKYGCRQLAQHPSFALVAILTLALGIGVSTALFSVIDAALLRPLPYSHPEELVSINAEETRPGREPSQFAPSMSDIRAWRTLATIVAHAGTGRVAGFVPLIVDTGTPQRLLVGEASEDFLETYGISPILGRAFRADDTREGAARVALLGHAFWQRQFGGSADVLGRTLRVENTPATIVGVLPAGFYSKTAVWQPPQFTPALADNRGSGASVIARLRPGVRVADASRALDSVTPPGRIFGPTPAPVHVVMTSMYQDETSGFLTTLRTLSAAVGLILILACVNVAGLMLARGATRDVELAIRASIGAGRGRLMQQLLTEGVLLALAGAALGVVLASLSLDSLVALLPLSLPANSPVTINSTVLAFALALTMVTTLLSGLVPALKLSRAPFRISSMLAIGGRSGAPLSRRGGQWLIGIEVALALVLVTGAGLILRSFARLVAVDLGFNTANVLTLEVEPLDRTTSVRWQYYTALADELRRQPEVLSAGAVNQLALTGGGSWFSFRGAGTSQQLGGFQHTILPGYFKAMGVHPIAGRLLEEGDRPSGDAVVVNAMAARQAFQGNAVGQTLVAGDGKRDWRIVGVVPDIRHGGPESGASPTVYALPDQHTENPSSFDSTLAMVVRLRPGASLPPDRVTQIAESLGPRVLVGKTMPAAALVSEQVATPRRRMLLLTLLGAFGLLLALVGIFSMTAYAVARRTREIGVRVAFGAQPGQVVAVMLRDVAWPVALGLVAGLGGTYYATRVIASFLFETPPQDLPTIAAAVALLGGAAAAAAWLPARRAASVDPLTALRAE